MKKIILVLLSAIAITCATAQTNSTTFSKTLSSEIERSVIEDYNVLRHYFEEAYSLHPSVPRGILEAVSFNYTRFHHLKPDLSEYDSNSIPATYGVMGLTLDGKGYFRESLRRVSELSGFPVDSITASPRISILAYAAAYARLQKEMKIASKQMADHCPILLELCELPLSQSRQQQFAISSNLYAIFTFLENDVYRSAMGIELPGIQYERCFGETLPLLRANKVTIGTDGGINAEEENAGTRGVDYGGALWNPAASCNYSSRNGRTVSAITIHYTQGTYASAISWFQNCSAQVSAHYVLRSSDGQITQMVRESDKAWHVGNCNGYTVGLEHEAYGNIYSYFTPIMYEKSAALTRDICDRNGISPLRMFYRDTLDNGTVLNNGVHDLGGETACTKIRGHQHFPGQSHTDPGKYWNWNHYFKLVNHDTPVTTYTAAAGTLTDAGGVTGNYGNDERKLYLIKVDGAENITLSFSEFALETDYDFLWIYDGNSVFSPLIGRWNTTSPGTITSSGNALLVEFRSDCATTAAGWVAQWTANLPVTDQQPETEIVWDENQWATGDFQVQFHDEDDNGIAYRFYQVMGNDGNRWTANPQQGFYCDNFDDFNASLWTVLSGNWRVESNQLKQDMQGNSVLTTPLRTNTDNAYLYDFYAGARNIGSNNGHIGVFFHCDQMSHNDIRNGYLLQISPATHDLMLYKIQAGTKLLLASAHQFTSATATYFYRIVHNAGNGEIKVFRNNELLIGTSDGMPFPFEGSYFGFVTENEGAVIDNLRVYRSRGSEVMIAANNSASCEACYQANHQIARTKIKSVVVDNAGQFSTLKEKLVKVDFSQPRFRGIAKHCFTPSSTANASTKAVINIICDIASDIHSDILGYEFLIEQISSNRHKIYSGFSESRKITYSLPYPTTAPYSVKVRALNQAGLYSPYVESYEMGTTNPPLIGRRNLELTVSPNPASDYVSIVLVPNPTETAFESDDYSPKVISKMEDTENADYKVRVYDVIGKLMLEQRLVDMSQQISIRDWTPGLYIFQILSQEQIVGWEKVLKK